MATQATRYCNELAGIEYHWFHYDDDERVPTGIIKPRYGFLELDYVPHECSYKDYQLRWMIEYHNDHVKECYNCYPPMPKPKDTSIFHRYLLTLQWNRKVTEEVWRKACDSLLKNKKFKHGVYVYERGSKGTNPHCHLLVFCKSKLCHNAKVIGHPRDQYKGHFEKFEYTYGHIDFKIVKNDNGIQEYMSKEHETEKQYFSNTTDTVHPLQPCQASSVPPDASASPVSDFPTSSAEEA